MGRNPNETLTAAQTRPGRACAALVRKALGRTGLPYRSHEEIRAGALAEAPSSYARNESRCRWWMAMLGLTTAKPRLEYWPAETAVTQTDIVIAGISLRRLAEVCSTPTVHSAASVIPGGGKRASSDCATGVLVTRVLAIAEHDCGAPVIQVDARLDNLRLVWSEARLIGARPGARSTLSLLVRRAGTADIESTGDVLAVDLPVRIAVGDLLAIPSRSISSASPHSVHPVTGRTDWRPDSVFDSAGQSRDGRETAGQ